MADLSRHDFVRSTIADTETDPSAYTEHCVTSIVPIVVDSQEWVKVESLRLFVRDAGLWFAAFARVDCGDYRITVDGAPIQETHIRAAGETTFAEPPSIGLYSKHWIHAPVASGFRTVAIEARGSGRIMDRAVYATEMDPYGIAPGNIFSHGRHK